MALVFLVVLISMVASTMAANWQANPNDCGKQYQGVNAMIIGGEPAEEYAWPWQVAMFEDGGFICGGSIVDPWWVISAAHCVDALYLCKPEVYSFRAGSISMTTDTNVTQVRQASKIYVHPNYDLEGKAKTENDDNDIALFKMKEPFILDEDYKVNSVCLPTGDMEDEFVVGQNATVTGWGTRQSGKADNPDTLYEVVVPIYDQTRCNQSYAGLITDNMICAGLDEGGKDACQGDSGGPLVAYPSSNLNQYHLAGIVSFGNDCGKPSFTGVYTRVTRYENWIRPIFNSYTPETSNSYDCGKTYEGMNSMIVGGEPAEEYAWPWQVAMFKNGNFVRCGGSLIDPWWVMTAAHCVDRCYLCNPEAYEFRIGSTSLTKDTDVTQQLRVSRIFAHPDFKFENWDRYDHDIALFKLKEPATLTDDYRVNTVCLPSSDMDDEFVVGQDAVATGWGTTIWEGWDGEQDYPDVLNEVVVPIYNDSDCDHYLLDGNGVTENMICAGLKEGSAGSCNGDSGGPLVAYPMNNTDQYYQIGVNWGVGCGTPNEAGVYTKVTRYEDWIRSFLNTTIQESYVPCVCRAEEEEEEEEKLSSSTVVAISVLSALLAIFIGISVGLGLCLHRQGKKETQEK